VRKLEYHHVDLAIVDVGLPDGSGLDLVRAVRAATGAGARLDARLPIVLVSGRSAEIDRVRGFERGADDFVAKPFAYSELRLRVAALLRRTRERRAAGRLRVGELAIDPASREVRLRGVPVTLSQKEFALLSALAAEPTRVFTKQELLRDVCKHSARFEGRVPSFPFVATASDLSLIAGRRRTKRLRVRGTKRCARPGAWAP
jgi:DNA-binding response OmpR family regulator